MSTSIPQIPVEPVRLKPTASAFRLALNNPNPNATGAGANLGKSSFGGDGRPPFGFTITDLREKKRRPAPILTSKNWMLQYCRAVSESNRHLRTVRRERLRPFPSIGSHGFRPEDGTTRPIPPLPTGATVEPQPIEMEWRDVEVDVRLNTEGRILESGEESDTKTEEEEEEESEAEVAPSVPPPANPGSSISRITNPLPLDSIITVYGPDNASRSVDQSHAQDRSNMHLSAGGNLSRAHSPGFNSHGGPNRARARSPQKKLTKPLVKQPKNQWWTTTVRLRELRPKEAVMGLLDIHGHLPHVRCDTQPTIAMTEKVDDVPHLHIDRHKRKHENDDLNGIVDDNPMDCDLPVDKRWKESDQGLVENPNSNLLMTSVVIAMTDELCPRQRPLLPGMWDFRSIEL